MEISVTGTAGVIDLPVLQALAGVGISVDTVAPEPLVTPFRETIEAAAEIVDEWTSQAATEAPVKRFGQPRGLSAIMAFLASQDASYITGVESNLDGGFGQI